MKFSDLLSGEEYSGQLGALDSAAIAECIVCGGWPAALGNNVATAAAMARSYVDVVAEEDLSRVDGVRRDPEKIRGVISSLARNESTLATIKTLIEDLGGEVTRQTASAYVSLLARLSFVCNVPALSPAMRSHVRLRESSKHHLADPSHAAGNKPPVAKVAIIGYGAQAHVNDRGIQVVPLDVLAP